MRYRGRWVRLLLQHASSTLAASICKTLFYISKEVIMNESTAEMVAELIVVIQEIDDLLSRWEEEDRQISEAKSYSQGE